MMPYVKFLISVAGGALGLAIFLTWPTWLGAIGFAVVFFAGTLIASGVFERYATPEQKKRDLAHRKRFAN